MEIIIIVLSCSSIVEVLSTTCLRRIMFIQIINEVTERKEITRGSLLDFVLLVLGYRKSLLKGSVSGSFSETVTYNWQMTLTCLSPSSICNDFICTRGHQLLWLRAKETFLLSSLQIWKSFLHVVVVVLFS